MAVGSVRFVGAGADRLKFLADMLNVGMLVYLLRVNGRLTKTSRAPQAATPEVTPVWFRHDGESIAAYPSRRKLARQAAAYAGVAALGALALIFIPADTLNPVLCWGLILLLVLYYVVPNTIRVIYPRPSLIVTSDGITDLASAQIFGFGLIPWEEIGGYALQRMSGRYRLRRLVIYPVNYQRLLQHQPALKRPFLRSISAFSGRYIVISSRLLPDDPVQWVQRMHEFVLAHAPATYLEPEDQHSAEVGEHTGEAGGALDRGG